jgi:hypothetical protein
LSHWEGHDVVLKLCEAGREALQEAFETSFVQVYVQWADESGLWIVRDKQQPGEITVMLIKWHHFETAQLDVVIAPQGQSRTLGFVR